MNKKKAGRKPVKRKSKRLRKKKDVVSIQTARGKFNIEED